MHEEPWLTVDILLMSLIVISTFIPMSTGMLYLRFHLTLLAENINEAIHYVHRVFYSVGFGNHRERWFGIL